MSPDHPSLSYGRVGGRPVFMDLQSDLYFLTDAEEEQQQLIASAVEASPPAARSSLLDQPMPAPPVARDVLGIFLDLVRIRRALRRRPIAALVAGAAGSPLDIIEAREDASLIAARFAAARKAVPVARNCLPDSLALLAWLGRRGIGSTLVFGVKLDPFAAHCWVQSDCLLLTDRLEEVERFTPVRSIACAPATR